MKFSRLLQASLLASLFFSFSSTDLWAQGNLEGLLQSGESTNAEQEPVILGLAPQGCSSALTASSRLQTQKLKLVIEDDAATADPANPARFQLALKPVAQGLLADTARQSASGLFVLAYRTATEPTWALEGVTHPLSTVGCMANGFVQASAGHVQEGIAQGDSRLTANGLGNTLLALVTAQSLLKDAAHGLSGITAPRGLSFRANPNGTLALEPALVTAFEVEAVAATQAAVASAVLGGNTLFAVRLEKTPTSPTQYTSRFQGEITIRPAMDVSFRPTETTAETLSEANVPGDLLPNQGDFLVPHQNQASHVVLKEGGEFVLGHGKFIPDQGNILSKALNTRRFRLMGKILELRSGTATNGARKATVLVEETGTQYLSGQKEWVATHPPKRYLIEVEVTPVAEPVVGPLYVRGLH